MVNKRLSYSVEMGGRRPWGRRVGWAMDRQHDTEAITDRNKSCSNLVPQDAGCTVPGEQDRIEPITSSYTRDDTPT